MWQVTWSRSPVRRLSFCTAVIGSGGVLNFFGSSWSGHDNLVAGDLTSVSCPTASFCAAVGRSYGFTYSGPTAAPEATTTTITSVTSSPVAFQPIFVGVEVIGGPTVPTEWPSGQVNVSDGTQSCWTGLIGSDGISTGSCSITEEAPGNYSLTASYQSGNNFGTSTTLTPTLITVGKSASTMALDLSAPKVNLGEEGAEQLSVAVLPEFAGSTPTGIVTVKDSTATLCMISLSAGEGSCTLSESKLPVGTYSLVATYSGSAGFDASASATKTSHDREGNLQDGPHARTRQGRLWTRRRRTRLDRGPAGVRRLDADWDRDREGLDSDAVHDLAVGRRGLVHLSCQEASRRYLPPRRHLQRKRGIHRLGLGDDDSHDREGNLEDGPHARTRQGRLWTRRRRTRLDKGPAGVRRLDADWDRDREGLDSDAVHDLAVGRRGLVHLSCQETSRGYLPPRRHLQREQGLSRIGFDEEGPQRCPCPPQLAAHLMFAGSWNPS